MKSLVVPFGFSTHSADNKGFNKKVLKALTSLIYSIKVTLGSQNQLYNGTVTTEWCPVKGQVLLSVDEGLV